jgi:hypothetical protein
MVRRNGSNVERKIGELLQQAVDASNVPNKSWAGECLQLPC